MTGLENACLLELPSFAEDPQEENYHGILRAKKTTEYRFSHPGAIVEVDPRDRAYARRTHLQEEENQAGKGIKRPYLIHTGRAGTRGATCDSQFQDVN
jgi:hypothetical protein